MSLLTGVRDPYHFSISFSIRKFGYPEPGGCNGNDAGRLCIITVCISEKSVALNTRFKKRFGTLREKKLNRRRPGNFQSVFMPGRAPACL
jgi:hypothetical protein